MKRLLMALLLVSIFAGNGFSQFGIGATGGGFYPGLMKDDKSGSRFEAGWGFGLFLRHSVEDVIDTLDITGRYAYRRYVNKIVLPNVLDTWFTFTYLNVDFLITLKRYDDFKIYTGIGAGLLTATADKDFLHFTDSQIIPEILVGVEWQLGKSYNVFVESSMQFGSINGENGESIPITGFRFIAGATMFLTE